MTQKVSVEVGKCVAGGACSILAPSVFDLDDEGIVVLLKTEVDGEDEEAALEAADACPGNAILLTSV